ncbi:MAG: ABC transporter permease [Phycisphaerales bacterium]
MVLCGVTIKNQGTLALAIVCTGLCFVGLMTLIASIAKTERAAQGFGWAGMMPLAMLGGAAVPSFAMPEFIQSLAHISPIYWCMRLLEGGLWRDLTQPGAMQSVVYVPMAVTLGIALGGFTLGVAVLRRP